MYWQNLREEPLVFINGQPFVVREADQPFSNLEYTGESSFLISTSIVVTQAGEFYACCGHKDLQISVNFPSPFGRPLLHLTTAKLRSPN